MPIPSPTRAGPVALVLCVLALAPATAAERLLVVVRSSADRALVQRVRGQTTDLGVEVLAAEDAEPGETPEQQLRTAARLAVVNRVDAVAWLVWEPLPGPVAGTVSSTNPAPARLVLRLFLRRADRLLERQVDDSPGAGSSPQPTVDGRVPSAALESAAVVIRGALQVASSGGPVGEPAPAAVVAAGVASAGQPLPATPLVPPPPPWQLRPRTTAPNATPNGPSATAPRGSLAAGWNVVLDGHPGAGRHAIALRGALTLGWAELALEAALGVGLEVAQPTATLVLARHNVAVLASLRGGPWRGVELLVGLHLGAVAYARATTGPAAGFRATPASWTLSPLVGLRGTLRWSPAGAGPRPLIDVTLGGDFAPGTPALGWHDGATFRTTSEPWSVQPWAQLAAGVRF